MKKGLNENKKLEEKDNFFCFIDCLVEMWQKLK